MLYDIYGLLEMICSVIFVLCVVRCFHLASLIILNHFKIKKIRGDNIESKEK